MKHLLERLGLGSPQLRAWAMYDWANSAYYTTIVAAVFPIYYQSVVAADLPDAVATSRFAWATTIAIMIVAFVAPLLGAIADYASLKKRMLAIFALVGALSAMALFWVERGDWGLALMLFVIGNIGVAGSIVFYESLLPHLVEPKDLDRVSSAGYAIGYCGGGVLLAINLLMIQKPGWFGIPDAGTGVRLALASVGVWWLLFSIPLFRRVPEPPPSRSAGPAEHGNIVMIGVRRLVQTFRELRQYKQAFLLLLAFLVYNDGIQTIIRMATIFGTEIGIDQSAMITALLITQFIGVPFAFVFGALAGRIGAKVAVFCGLAVYAFIIVLAYFMSSADPLLCPGDPRRHGPGRNAGAQPVDVREHDPAPQVVGVLRLLRRLRALRRHSRAADLCRHDRSHGREPERHPRGAVVLRDWRRYPHVRRRRSRAARRRGPRKRRL